MHAIFCFVAWGLLLHILGILLIEFNIILAYSKKKKWRVYLKVNIFLIKVNFIWLKILSH